MSARLRGRARTLVCGPIVLGVLLAGCNADPPAASDSEVIFAANVLDRVAGDRETARSGQKTFAVRSVREFALAPVRAGEPLIEVRGPDGAALPGFGRVTVPGSAFLGQLVNTGWVAATADGGVVFASAVSPRVQRFDASGQLRWVNTRPTAADTTVSLSVVDGRLEPRFREAQHGVAVGPDGRIYVLADAGRDSVSLVIVREDGVWLRSARIPRGVAVRADRAGRVALGAAEQRAPRAAFPDVQTPSLTGGPELRLADYRGRVVVVNVWASWCGPCREEMPVLDRFARGLDPARVAVIGLNEDERPDEARRFLREIGGVGYPLGEGRGDLKGLLKYRGLPYTVILDGDHRVVRALHGFASIEPVRAAVEEALTSAREGSP